jgi:hypothetical protein
VSIFTGIVSQASYCNEGDKYNCLWLVMFTPYEGASFAIPKGPKRWFFDLTLIVSNWVLTDVI